MGVSVWGRDAQKYTKPTLEQPALYCKAWHLAHRPNLAYQLFVYGSWLKNSLSKCWKRSEEYLDM